MLTKYLPDCILYWKCEWVIPTFRHRIENKQRKNHMLRLAVTLLIIAIVAAILGFGGIAGTAAWIAKIAFIVFLILAVLSFVSGRRVKV